MRSNPVKFSENRAEVMSAWRNVEAHHLLDCFNPNQSIRNCGDIIEPVPVRRNHGVHAVLGNLFHAAMQVTDVAIKIDYGFSVKL